MNSVPSAPAMPRRRTLLGALSGLVVAPGLTLFAAQPEAGASNRVRWGLLVDARQCATDCDACVRACNQFNALAPESPELRPGQRAQWLRKVELTDTASGAQVSLPLMCQHCAAPPCVDVCPTGASFKRADGIVLVDRHLCIGCRYCMMACPYKARSFVHEPLTQQSADVPRGKGCVEACNFCVTRLDRGDLPACVEACAGRPDKAPALFFGDLNDPNSVVSRRLREAGVGARALRADLALQPTVRYVGV